MSKIQLPAEVAKEFELVRSAWPSDRHTKLHFGPNVGSVDLEKLTPIRARALVAHKVKFLKPRAKPAEKPASDAGEAKNKADKK